MDNIDLLEDTPTGQNTFHGTVIVINQLNVAGEHVNPPLAIPETLQSPSQLSFDVKYLPELTFTNAKPIRFDEFKLGGRTDLISKDYTHTWALATFLATSDSADITTSVNTDECQDQFKATIIDTTDIDTSTDASNMDTDKHQELFEATGLHVSITDSVDENIDASAMDPDQQHDPYETSVLPSGSVDTNT